MIKEIINLKKKYNGKCLEDAGCYVSKEYRLYQNAFVRAMKALAASLNAEVVGTTKGHYYESVFIEREGKYAYICHECITNAKIDFSKDLFCRDAESNEDYVGGFNRFPTIDNLPKMVDDILNETR